VLALTAGAVPTARADAGAVRPVRLVLQITVDQLRGDALPRNAARFGEGGFRRLLENGAVFTNAHYLHANTETVVGHSTLATGTTPSVHGMIGNLWFDRQRNRPVYNVEDDRYRKLGDLPAPPTNKDMDGPEAFAKSDGRSPAALLASTFADELIAANAGRSRAFAVALKDRAAVPMAGHGGKALWYSDRSGRFVTGTRYYGALPGWLADWNRAAHTDRYASTRWELLASPESYRAGDDDDRPYEISLPGFGRVFPHAYGPADGPMYYQLIAVSPAGDELTAELAERLIDAEKIGEGEAPDYLAVGFSSTDYVGHVFGPASLEAEDNLLRLDRTLAGLLDFVDERIGLSRTLVVLSADHGVSEAPELRRSRGMDAARFPVARLTDDDMRQALERRFGDGQLIARFSHPYIYLDQGRVSRSGSTLAQVQRFVAKRISTLPGVETAVAAVDIVAAHEGDSPLMRQLRANHHATRSGDVFVVTKPHWLPYVGEGVKPMAASHGSPWSYDTHVPLIFMGPGIERVHSARAVHPRDAAPTMSAYLGIEAPNRSSGEPLAEVLGECRPRTRGAMQAGLR
jgi:predicted AlkP superfamily pyrophosphatase or phosphodiesterase